MNTPKRIKYKGQIYEAVGENEAYKPYYISKFSDRKPANLFVMGDRVKVVANKWSSKSADKDVGKSGTIIDTGTHGIKRWFDIEFDDGSSSDFYEDEIEFADDKDKTMSNKYSDKQIYDLAQRIVKMCLDGKYIGWISGIEKGMTERECVDNIVSRLQDGYNAAYLLKDIKRLDHYESFWDKIDGIDKIISDVSNIVKYYANNAE